MYKSLKTMRQALEEARSYRDPIKEDKGYTDQQVKQAYGILNDPRYKQGNYSGAVKAIEKLAKGLSDHPDVANALKRANESVEEAKTAGGALAQGNLETMTDQGFKEFYGITKDEYIKKYGDPSTRKEEKDLEEFTRQGGGEVRYDNQKSGWFNKAGKRIYLGKADTQRLMSKDLERKVKTGDWITPTDLSKEENEKTI